MLVNRRILGMVMVCLGISVLLKSSLPIIFMADYYQIVGIEPPIGLTLISAGITLILRPGTVVFRLLTIPYFLYAVTTAWYAIMMDGRGWSGVSVYVGLAVVALFEIRVRKFESWIDVLVERMRKEIGQ